MNILDAVKIAPAIAAVVTVATGAYSLTTTQRDRSLAKFAHEVAGDAEVDAVERAYWVGEGAAALRRMRARRVVPARFIAVPLCVCAYVLSLPYVLGAFWRDVAADPSWSTWVFWPQSTMVDMPPTMIIVLTVVLSWFMLAILSSLLDRRDALAGRPEYRERLPFWALNMAALSLLVHAAGIGHAFSGQAQRNPPTWLSVLVPALLLGAMVLFAMARMFRRTDSFWDRWRAAALPWHSLDREDTTDGASPPEPGRER